MPKVRADEPSGYGHVSTKIYWMDRLPNFFKYGALCSLPSAFAFSPIYTKHVKLKKNGSGSGIIVVFSTL